MRIETIALAMIMLVAAFSAKAGFVVLCGDGSQISGISSAKHFVSALDGALIGKSGDVVLSRRIGDDQLELRGQDADSYWNARCDRSKIDPAQFMCVGSGAEFADGKAFELRSTLTMTCPPIVEDWIVTQDGKTTRSGRHELTPLAPLKPITEPVPSVTRPNNITR